VYEGSRGGGDEEEKMSEFCSWWKYGDLFHHIKSEEIPDTSPSPLTSCNLALVMGKITNGSPAYTM
jgi:hypothetical protein